MSDRDPVEKKAYLPHDFLLDHLKLGVSMVQGGNLGTPTMDDLQACGMIHSIIEFLSGDKVKGE